MVFLGAKGGEIDIRLVKPPFDVNESARVYIDEYEMLGTPYPEKGIFESYRYIASEDTMYAIEVTLKKGFNWCKYEALRVEVHDRAKKARIGYRNIWKGNREKLLAEDEKILVTSLNCAIIDGSLETKLLWFFAPLLKVSFSAVPKITLLLTMSR